MKARELMRTLQDIIEEGNGDLDVYYRHGASGDCGPLSSPRVTEECNPETGPFDTTSPYICLYAGY